MQSISQDVMSNNKIIVSDGAWGTFLQQKGLQTGECPELWNITHRDVVMEIARAYIDAGAELIKTNSFGGNKFKLSLFGLTDQLYKLNREAAAISREAAGNTKHVIASMGPTGKLLLMEDVTEKELYNAFCEQAIALQDGGADACCIETFSAINEATIAIQAVRENTKLEIICTFTFERTVSGQYRTMMGVSPTDMALALKNAGAHIIGTNCGNGMAQMVEIVREIRQAVPDMPIIVHANAGMPRNVNGKVVFPETPDEMAKNAKEVVKEGANIIGGCCGTTPDHIRAMVRAIRNNINQELK